MYFRTVSLALSILFCLAHAAVGQQRICINGRCFRTQVVPTAPPVWRQDSRGVSGITLDPLREELWLGGSDLEADEEAQVGDRFDQVIEATVRVTTNGSCGSGTIVGRDKDGNAIVLTNAHVAGTTRGRAVNLERWNTDGASERGNGTIIASGYGRGTNVDFALLKCNAEFAQDVAPIPLADRYPSGETAVTTFGCPRCEWPSLQVLKLSRKDGQILSWKPEAIGGRSGSSIIDYADDGPRVVGLLTWAGGGEGLGQSTPFLLSAMRGKLPAMLEGLPPGAREVSGQPDDPFGVFQVPATLQGEPLRIPVSMLAQVQDDVIDSIVDRPSPKPAPREPENPQPSPGTPGDSTWTAGQLIATSAASSILLLLGLQYGIPLVLQGIRQMRKSRGQTILTDEQFQQLLDQYKQLLTLLEQNARAKPPQNAGSQQ